MVGESWCGTCRHGLIFPGRLKPAFIGLSLVTFPMGVLVNELSLGLIFFLVFVPIGIAFRLMGRDPLHREFEAETPSYWQAKRRPVDVASYFRRW